MKQARFFHQAIAAEGQRWLWRRRSRPLLYPGLVGLVLLVLVVYAVKKFFKDHSRSGWHWRHSVLAAHVPRKCPEDRGIEGAADKEPSEDHRAQNGEAAEEHSAMREGRIPWQLVLTSKTGSIEDLPLGVQKNVNRTISLNPGFRVRWLSDAQCRDYIRKHYNESLARIFTGEPQGSFRGDICRAAVLAQEGGFYLDMDLELKEPLKSFVDPETTFVSAFDLVKRVYNAVLATEPFSPIMLESINEIYKWYDKKEYKDRDSLLGTVSTLRALRAVVQSQCPGEPLHPDNKLQRPCGNQVIRMYWERYLDCQCVSLECPRIRAESLFSGVHLGIYTTEFKGGKLVGWSRFADCAGFGCDTGGNDVAFERIPSKLGRITLRIICFVAFLVLVLVLVALATVFRLPFFLRKSVLSH